MNRVSMLVTSVLLVLTLAACAGAGDPMISTNNASSETNVATMLGRSTRGGATVYVMNVEPGPEIAVTVYTKGGASLLRTISLGKSDANPYQ